MTSERMHAILDNPRSAKNIDELKNAVKRADAELRHMSDTVGTNNTQYEKLASSTKKAKQELKQMEEQSSASGTAFEKAISRLKTYVGVYVSAAVAMQKIIGTMGDLLELSDKMGEVRKTTGFTADEVGRLSENLRKLDVRTSLVQLVGLSAVAGQMGLKTQEDIVGFTKAANMLMVALPEMGQEGATSLMKIANATGDLKKNGGDVEETLQRVGSTIIALRANSASTAPAITDFVRRVGAVASQADISIDQIAALGSTIDALGGRVEMSATALSRMIPAIRNNAFGVANAIGVAESELTELFKQGKAMEAMVLIFRKMRESVQQFDVSTEAGMDAMASKVESILGKDAKMADVMKELNQTGARAGIVFGLMSQNVDELEKQLGIAAKAYNKNIDLLNEFNNMNETTAAKLARLKNELEEFFVSNQSQKMLGYIIDGLRSIVNLLTGSVAPALDFIGILLKTLLLRWALAKAGIGEALLISLPKAIVSLKVLAVTAFSTIGTQIKAAAFYMGIHTMATKRAAVAMKSLNAAQMANFWVALALAIAYAAKALYDWSQRLNSTVNALSEAEANLSSTTREAGILFHQFTQLTKKQDELNKSTKTLKEREKELEEELEALRKKLGDGAEQSETFKKKQEELAQAHKETAKTENKAKEATSERLSLINEINSKYSTYLGYMLSEASTAETVASAHDLIVASLKEEMYWREQNKAFETVTEQHQEDLTDYRKDALAELNDMSVMHQQNIMSAWQGYLEGVTYDASKGGFVIPGAEKAFRSIEDAMDVLKQRFDMTLSNEGGYDLVHPDDRPRKLNDLWGESGAGGWGSWTRWTDRGFKDWTRESLKVLQEAALLQNMSGSAAAKAHETSIQKAVENTNALIAQAQERGGDVTNRQLAEAVVGIEKNLSKYGEIAGRYTQFGNDTSLQGIANVLLKDLPAKTRKAVEAEIQRVAARGITPQRTSPIKDDPYGNFDKVKSDYSEWDADSLVARRKDMLERVRALANGADVQKVLSEDAKFISEATRNNIKTTKEAIEWYNAERLKIQDALHQRHLTNTGDWMEPKKEEARKKQFETDLRAYLEELDAYYTERKTKIQQAQTEEGITEAEVRNRTLANEVEWRQRRAELQKLYADKAAEVTQEEQDAIYDIIAERTGDDAKFIEKMIGKTVDFSHKVRDMNEQGAKEYRKWMADLGLGWERDFMKQQQAVTQQMKAIQDIIDRERPFNGITKNLRENLVTMGILTADMTKERNSLMKEGADMADFNARQAAEEIKRTAFVLGEAENAYSTTIEEVMRRMADKGMTAWADELKQNPKMQEGLMAQLRSTFDAIQDTIKKEASLLKKEAENLWNNILMPDGKTTLKEAADKAIAQLSLDEGRVKRANSLVGTGQASERVADKLAIKQMQIQLTMQEHYYNLMRKRGKAAIDILNEQAKKARELGDIAKAERLEQDAKHATMSLNLAKAKEETELAKQREEIIARTEESQNRLYTELKSWAELLSSSLQSVFEASNTGNAEYYNERAKLQLTGGSGKTEQYIVIDNAGTSDAKAHYETLTELEALERKHEIEQQNAMADAWKKVMDDINAKLNETITDQLNAMLQNQSVDMNTDAVTKNTEALLGLTATMQGQGSDSIASGLGSGLNVEPGSESGGGNTETQGVPLPVDNGEDAAYNHYVAYMTASEDAKDAILDNQKTILKGEQETNKKMTASAQSMYAKMTTAMNLYGIAYQAMSNDNLSTAQKFEMIAVQAAGQAAIAALSASMSQSVGQVAAETPAVASKAWSQLGPIGGAAAVAVFTALIGGLIGFATSKIAKSKSEIAAATGASGNSVASGRLVTGMLTYAEGNVNEFTDPNTLTPGRQYNVDAADGRTYRARYMGKNPRTHITNGPEFHLAGERGREAIIDAATTRHIQMDEVGIWRAIQTLSAGGRIGPRKIPGRGIAAFADGNLDELGDMGAMGGIGTMGGIDLVAVQASLDRNSAIQEALLERLSQPIQAKFDVYGKGGLVDSYDTGKKTAQRYGQRY